MCVLALIYLFAIPAWLFIQMFLSQGHADAIFYLAQAHRSGAPELSIQKDVQRFSTMVQEAAERGSEDAMFALGDAYFHGEDAFDRNPRAAFR